MHYLTLYQYGLPSTKLFIMNKYQAYIASLQDRHEKVVGQYVHCLEPLPSARSYAIPFSIVELISECSIARHRCIDAGIMGLCPGMKVP
jgi:hypothetical protein